MYAHFLIVPFLSPSLVANVGFAEKQLTWIYFLGGSSSVFTSPIVGRLVDRFGMYRVYAFFCFTAVIPITLITHLTPVPVWVGLMVTTSFFMLAGSRMIPGTTMATAVVGAAQRGSFMSINSSLQNFCLSAATLTAGLIIVRAEDGHLLHYNRVGYLAIVVGFISLFMASRVKRYLRF
jgi:predicted MFS family arabinose efflux permease